MGSLAVDMAKGTHYLVSCHDHNATNMISQKGALHGLREKVEIGYKIYFPMRMEDCLPYLNDQLVDAINIGVEQLHFK